MDKKGSLEKLGMKYQKYKTNVQHATTLPPIASKSRGILLARAKIGKTK